MRSVRWLLLLGVLLLGACSLSEPTPFPVSTPGPSPTPGPTATDLIRPQAASPQETAPSPAETVFPTSTPPLLPSIPSRELILEPVLRVENGIYVVAGGETLTVRWDDVPVDGTYRFALTDPDTGDGERILTDGALPTARFTVPPNFVGEVTGTAFLADGTTIGANPVRVVAEAAPGEALSLTGECRYIPAALGPGETLYADADVNSPVLGQVDATANYLLVTSREGPGSRGEVVVFHQITSPDTNITAWVLATVGGRLAGDCTL